MFFVLKLLVVLFLSSFVLAVQVHGDGENAVCENKHHKEQKAKRNNNLYTEVLSRLRCLGDLKQRPDYHNNLFTSFLSAVDKFHFSDFVSFIDNAEKERKENGQLNQDIDHVGSQQTSRGVRSSETRESIKGRENFVKIKDALGDDTTTDTGFSSNNGTEEKARRDVLRKASSVCFQDVARTVQAFIDEESWAIEMLDAWGKPGPSLTRGRFQFVGNYDQCRDARAPPPLGEERQGFHGRYCVLRLDYGQESSFDLTGVPTLSHSKQLQIGSCIPDSCKEQELTQLVRQALEMVNMTSQLSPGPMECRDDHRGGSTFTTLAAIFFSIIGALMIAGTVVDVAYVQWPAWEAERVKSRGLTHKESTPSEGQEPQKSGQDKPEQEDRAGETSALSGRSENYAPPSPFWEFVLQVLLSFSVYSNAQKILSTKEAPGAISCIHGLRFFSMTWLMLLHLHVMFASYLANPQRLLTVLDSWSFDTISNGFIGVDTFFTLGGFLVSYVKLKPWMEKGRRVNWRLFYFHRIWRLTPPYMLSLVFFMGFLKFFGSGVNWSNILPADAENCEKYWWTNLLYVNNLLYTRTPCMVHSWYLANDMQFYLLSPLLFVPFYYNMYAGLAVCGTVLLSSWIVTGVLSWNRGWVASDFAMVFTHPQLDRGIGYYMAPYTRVGPFVIGILAGYLMARHGGRIAMKWYVVVVGWAVAVATCLAVVYGIHGDITAKDPSSTEVAALYNTLSRSAWSVAISWVVIACASGYGGPVNWLLSLKPLIVLSRLSYLGYLIHPYIMYIYFGNQGTPFMFTDSNMIFGFVGVLGVSCMCSFLFHLAVESPMVELEKTFLKKH
ncbi:O-acyltransferase like protein [Aplysia californica]|uniref:O-acyltransferase like protein n=1 Tax=Aplysia californica TaxID=6500 RepID=A0ABM0KAH1_APLCA|nr:O-acyltransferase like protein [Aplysia californica]